MEIHEMPLKTAIAEYNSGHYCHLYWIKEGYKAMKLIEAIEAAAKGLNPVKDNIQKMNSHQWRIGAKICALGAEKLLREAKTIEKVKNFVDLFTITEKVRKETKGLGNLWSYDTALRIAFNKGESCYPKAVYVQSGVADGVKKLLGNQNPIGRSLSAEIIYAKNKELKSLKPYMLEHFFCVWGKSEREKKGNRNKRFNSSNC